MRYKTIVTPCSDGFTDELAERNVRMLQLPPASSRNTASLQNWVEDTGAICRKETSFLHKTDLCAAGGSGHHGLELVESMVERSVIKFQQWLGQVRRNLPY